MYANLERHILDTSSTAWQALEQLGMADQIYDKSQGRVLSLRFEGDRFDHGFIDYIDDYSLNHTLLQALPSSVTKLKWKDGMDGHDERPFPARRITAVAQVADLLYQRESMLSSMNIWRLPSFPRLHTLRLRSGLSSNEQYDVWGGYRTKYQLDFLDRTLSSMSLAHLKDLHIDRYVVSTQGFLAILDLGARHDLNLTLENMMVLATIDTYEAEKADSNDILVYTIFKFWWKLSRLARSRYPDYMTSGRVCIHKAITSVRMSQYRVEHDVYVWNHTLKGEVLDMFQRHLLTGENEDTIYTKLKKMDEKREQTERKEKKVTTWAVSDLLEEEGSIQGEEAPWL